MKFWEVAGAPRMWGTVGDGDVMVDCRDLEGVKERLLTARIPGGGRNGINVDFL